MQFTAIILKSLSSQNNNGISFLLSLLHLQEIVCHVFIIGQAYFFNSQLDHN